MNGSGCKNCPVKNCETVRYRGSTCAAQRAKFGLGDPRTNADRIRAMTDEELAEWALYKAQEIGREYNDSLLGLVEWLQQPTKEVAG